MPADGVLAESASPTSLPGDDEGRRGLPCVRDLGAPGGSVRYARGADSGPYELGTDRSPGGSGARCAAGRHPTVEDREDEPAARSLRTLPLPGIRVAPSSRRGTLPVARRAGTAADHAGGNARVSDDLTAAAYAPEEALNPTSEGTEGTPKKRACARGIDRTVSGHSGHLKARARAEALNPFLKRPLATAAEGPGTRKRHNRRANGRLSLRPNASGCLFAARRGVGR